MTRNEAFDSLIVKDENRMRLYNPDLIKERTARYYEDLYKRKIRRPHPYHEEVNEKNKENMRNLDYEQETYNQLPTKDEIREIVLEKKNGKRECFGLD